MKKDIQFKARLIRPYSDIKHYHAMKSIRKGKGWFALLRKDGKPAIFNREPESLEEAEAAIIKWNQENE